MTAAARPEAQPEITVEIMVEAGDWPDVDSLLATAARTAWSAVGDGAPASVSVALTDDDGIRRLNRTFRDRDKATDVLSFPAGEPAVAEDEPLLGDIALALDFIRKEAALENKSFENHLTHLFVHGLLHLLGYDHVDAAEAVEMEQAETEILALLGIGAPYAGREIDSDGK